MVLTPTLAQLGDVTVLAGAPLHIALNSSGGEGELEFEATVTGVDLSASILHDNQSMQISVAPHTDLPDGGDMVFELFEQRAPRTTSRIIELAKSHYYDGLTFHRIIEEFMIQGGYLDADGKARDPDDFVDGFSSFDDEFHADLQHTSAGVLSMAKSYDDTNSSQFFITADPTAYPDLRLLDFNHSVFGFLTEGEDVRKAIAGHGNSVVMSSVTIVEDPENAVLMLSAPEGTTGEAYVTVTVSDATGSTQQTFHVTVEADTHDSYPYLVDSDIVPIETTVDTPVDFQIPATDVEGNDTFYYGAWDLAYWPPYDQAWQGYRDPHLEVDVDPLTGEGTVTPSGGVAGVRGVLLGVNWYGAVEEAQQDPRALSGYWDFQFVPVFITPNAPSKIELLTKSPTNDKLTNRNNVGDDNKLRFRVSGLVPGAEVSLYADGDDEPIGQTTAQYDSVVVITDGAFKLVDGTHKITVVQALHDEAVDLKSDVSSPLYITVDTVPPEIISNPVTEAAEGRQYWYDVDTAEETPDNMAYHLAVAPVGMLVAYRSGRIAWTPSAGQAGTHSVKVVATDEAGNETPQAFQINVSPAPKLDPIGAKTVDEESTLSFTVSATGGQGTLEFSLDAGAPDGASIELGTNQFTWTPSEDQGPGQYGINVRVTDEVGASSTRTVYVTVNEVNQPPVLSAIADRSINEGQPLEFVATATDADLPLNTLLFDLGPDAPAGASIDLKTGRFTWTPDESQGGQDFVVTVRVWDEYEVPGVQTFTVTVNEVNDPPVFAPTDVQTAVAGEPLRIKVSAWDTDDSLNARQVIYSLDAAPEGAEIDQTGEITWDVPEDFLQRHDPRKPVELIVRATEDVPEGEEALSVTQTVRVMVQDPRLVVGFALWEIPAEDEESLIAPIAESRVLPAAPPPPAPVVPTPFAPIEQEGVFGMRIGAGTSHGGSEESEEATEEGETEQELEGADGKDEDEPKTSDEDADDNQEAFWRASLLEDLLAEIRDAAVEEWADEQSEAVTSESDDQSPSARASGQESSPAADGDEPSRPAGESQEKDSREQSPSSRELRRVPAIARKPRPAPSAASRPEQAAAS